MPHFPSVLSESGLNIILIANTFQLRSSPTEFKIRINNLFFILASSRTFVASPLFWKIITILYFFSRNYYEGEFVPLCRLLLIIFHWDFWNEASSFRLTFSIHFSYFRLIFYTSTPNILWGRPLQCEEMINSFTSTSNIFAIRKRVSKFGWRRLQT